MPRFQTDDDFYDDPAVSQAGTAAMGLYYRCGTYVARKCLDGFVPSAVSAQYGTPEWITRLVDAGLWETVPGGHYMPLYFAHGNPTAAKVEADRKLKSERQLRWLENKKKSSSGKRRVSGRSTRTSGDASTDGSKDSALPPSLTGRKPRAGANGALPHAEKPPWCGECDKRTRQLGDPDKPDRCPRCHASTQNGAKAS